MDEAAPLLRVQGVTKRFDGVCALDRVSLAIGPGEIRGLIGPNGAGKSTLVNVVAGQTPPTEGAVWFRDRPLTRLRPHRIAAAGIARTFQTIQLFPDMTVLETVMVGRHARTHAGLWGALWRTWRAAAEEAAAREHALEILAFLGLAARRHVLARNLPSSQQRLLELGRALATDPSLLLLDEPAAGMTREERRRLAEIIRAVRARGPTVFLIEHDLGLIMEVCDRVTVLHFGRTIAEGTPAAVRADAAVIAAYLGTRRRRMAPERSPRRHGEHGEEAARDRLVPELPNVRTSEHPNTLSGS